MHLSLPQSNLKPCLSFISHMALRYCMLLRTSLSPCLQCLLARPATLAVEIQHGAPSVRYPSSLYTCNSRTQDMLHLQACSTAQCSMTLRHCSSARELMVCSCCCGMECCCQCLKQPACWWGTPPFVLSADADMTSCLNETHMLPASCTQAPSPLQAGRGPQGHFLQLPAAPSMPQALLLCVHML
jgi:hypothetical protein